MAPREPALAALAYSVPQAAELMNVSDKHVWRLIKAGKIPTVRIGRRTVISRLALIEWLEQQSRSVAS